VTQGEGGEVVYLTEADFHQAAAEALGMDVVTASSITNDTLAGSALAAPAAGFGDFEKYPDFPTKTAVLMQAIARNHALPDGNKRTALLCGILFAALNGYRWEPPEADSEDGSETAEIVEAVAAGSLPLEDLAAWVSDRLVHLS
jgi:death-on-curing protein